MNRTRRRIQHSFHRSILPLSVAALSLFGAGCRFESIEEENLEVSIESMLNQYSIAWNAGDLDGVMQFYAEGAATSFMTDSGPVAGRSQIRTVFAPWFATDERHGQLRFEDVRVRPLPPLIGIVTGHYVVERSGSRRTGWFTFVVRRAGEGWRIVHDHAALEPQWN